MRDLERIEKILLLFILVMVSVTILPKIISLWAQRIFSYSLLAYVLIVVYRLFNESLLEFKKNKLDVFQNKTEEEKK